MRCSLYAIIDVMITVGKYLRKKRDEAELSLREASKLANVSHTHIMDIEEGKRSPTFDKVMNLLKAYRADVLDFLRETGYLPKNVEPTATGKMRRIPVVSWATAGKRAETGESFHKEEVLEWIASDVNGENNFALRVKGDSMEPEFKEGDILIVSPAAKAVNGDYVVAKNSEEEATFWQYKRYNNIKILHPLNTRYEDIVLSKSKGYRIIAVLAEMRRTYK
jgi:SOS-response transcriptional repressor LexA